jgi:hypothetical protein
MPSTSSRKSVAKKAPPVEPSSGKAAAAAAPKRTAASKPATRARPAGKKAAPRSAGTRATAERPVPEAENVAVAAAAPAVPAKPRLVHRPRLAPWLPRELPPPHTGKPDDPRLAAAVAARERWHGRSGRPALKSGTQAVAFARERGLVHPLDATPLPNLLDPIIGKACVGPERETGPAAATLASWRKELDRANDLLELRLCFERPTFVGLELWPALWTVVAPREEAARNGGMALPREAEEALELLDRKGALPVERLRSLLDLSPEELGNLRGLLESQLLVLARGEVDEDDGPITVLEPLGRWAARAAVPRRLEVHQAYTLLFAAAIRSAAVLWPEEIAALFPWTPEERDAAVAACLEAGAVVTYEEAGSVAYVASPVPR